MLDTHELAWLAGFFDGEGYSQSCAKNRTVKTGGRRVYSTIRVSIAQTNPEGYEVPYTLKRAQAALGFGNIHGPYPKGGNSRDVYIFNLSSFEQAQAAIAMMWKWLSPVKRKQAKDALLRWRDRKRRVTGRRPAPSLQAQGKVEFLGYI